MQIYGPAHVHGPQAVGAPHTTRAAPVPPRKWSRRRFKTKSTSPMPPAWSSRSSRPRTFARTGCRRSAQIASGTYETTGKLDVAVSRLLDEIG